MIKLICSDIDGTLLNKERQLSARTIDEVKRLKNIPFILISSRMPKAMFHLQQELQITALPMIAYNGGLIIHHNKILASTEIALKQIQKIADFCTNTKLHVSLYHNDQWFVPAMDYWAKREQHNTKVTPVVKPIIETLKTWNTEKKGAHKIMCMGDKDEIDALVNFIDAQCKDSIIAYRSKDTYLEIAPKAISKKTAIELLLQKEYPNLSLKNVMAFGDNYNDATMLKSVGIGVAVNNAKPQILALAKHKTDSNINDGVALFLKQYFN